jgi:hypothetical protein
MKMSHQLQILVALSPWKKPPVPSKQEAEWIQELIQMMWEKNKENKLCGFWPTRKLYQLCG